MQLIPKTYMHLVPFSNQHLYVKVVLPNLHTS